MSRILLILVLLICLIILQTCGSKFASYGYTQKMLQHEQIDFHKRLKVDEYINAFPQDGLVVPKGQKIVLNVTPFRNFQNENERSTIVQIGVRTRKPDVIELSRSKGLCFVLDNSGSMNHDTKFADAKAALIAAIQEFKNGDQFSLVVFNNEATTVISNVTIDQTSRSQVIADIDSLRPGGGTNIQSGLVAGYKEMSKFTVAIKRLILLTDGRSNVEYLTPQEFARVANVAYSESSLISTIGLGIDVNEKELREIAENGGGHYYFAESSKSLTKILREGLSTLTIPVIKRATLNVFADDNYRIKQVYGYEDHPGIKPNGFKLELGELNSDDWRIIMVELEGQFYGNQTTPLHSELTFEAYEDNKIYTHNDSTIIVRSTDRQAVVNDYVVFNSVIFTNALTLKKIGELNEQKRFNDAVKIVDLQIESNIKIKKLDTHNKLDTEINNLRDIRRILLKNGDINNYQPLVTESASNTLPEQSDQQSESKNSANVLESGLKIAGEFIPGPWGTVARLIGDLF